ncbi:hypothetical protein AAII07_02660 [Microvirga sp. 0TCS3.31]
MIVSTGRPLARALALAVLGLGSVLLAPTWLLPAADAATCTSPGAVSVVVDYRELGGGTVTACAPDGGGKSASAVFASVGVGIEYATRQPGFVCRVNSVPASDPCVNASPANAYWGLWWSDGTSSSWTFSSSGVGGLVVPAGGSVGWAWQQDRPSGAGVPPAVPPPVNPATPTATPTASEPSTSSPTTSPTSSPTTGSTAGSGGGKGGGKGGGSSPSPSPSSPSSPSTSSSPSPSGTPSPSPMASESPGDSPSSAGPDGASTKSDKGSDKGSSKGSDRGSAKGSGGDESPSDSPTSAAGDPSGSASESASDSASTASSEATDPADSPARVPAALTWGVIGLLVIAIAGSAVVARRRRGV